MQCMKYSLDWSVVSMQSLNSSCSRKLPGALLQLATSQALLCIPIWIFHVLGSPLGYVKLLAAVAAAMLLPVLLLPYTRSVMGRTDGCSGWLQQFCARRSIRTAQVPRTPAVPEAIQAILQLTVAPCRDRSEGSGGGAVRPAPPAAAPVIIAATASCPEATGSRAVAHTRDAAGKQATAAAVAAAADPGNARAVATAGPTTAGPAPYPGGPISRPSSVYGMVPRLLSAAAGTHAPSFPSAPANRAAAAAASTAAAIIGASLPKTASKPVPVPARVVGGSSLKAPVGLSRCTIVEDAPFPPPNTQVVMELHEKTLRVGGRRLRYRGYRPADRTLPVPAPLVSETVTGRPPPPAGAWAAAGPAAASGRVHAVGGGGTLSLSGAPGAAPSAAMIGGGSAGSSGACWGLLSALSRPPSASAAAARGSDPAVNPHAMAYHPNHPNHPNPRDGNFGYPSSENSYSFSHLDRVQQLQPAHGKCPAGPSRHPHPHHHLSMSIKVPWAHPSALPGGRGGGGGGLLESLNEALANGSGYLVVGAAVRPGCILLQVDLMATSGSSAELLRGIGMAAGAGGGGRRASGGGGGGGSELAAQLARHVGIAVQPPPDGSEVIVSLGGRLSYSFSYDAPTGEWSGTQLTDWAGGGGVGDVDDEAGTPAQLRRRLVYTPNGIQMRPYRPAAVVPASMEPRDGDGGAALAPAPTPPMLRLTLQLEVVDKVAAAWLAEQLRPLLLTAPSTAAAAPPSRHGGSEGWQLVANCLGRSLPVVVLRVIAPSSSVGAGGVEGATAGTVPATVAESGQAPRGASAAPADDGLAAMAAANDDGDDGGGDEGAGGGGGGDGGPATLRVEVGVMGSREALEAMCCRLAVLSVELWYGIKEVAQAPVMLVHEAVSGPPCDDVVTVTRAAADPGGAAASAGSTAQRGRTSPVDCSNGGQGGGDFVARVVAAELCSLAATAAAAAVAVDGAPEDEQSLRQFLADLGTLELYAASQLGRPKAAVAATTVVLDARDDYHDGGGDDGGSDDGDAAAGQVATPPAMLSWSTEGLSEEYLVLDDADADSLAAALAAAPSRPPPPALLLSGSVDVSAQLRRLLARDDAQQSHAMLLTGAHLLSYTVLHAMPCTANAIRQALAALGCGLLEADELSTTAAGAIEDDAVADGTTDSVSDPWVGGDAGGGRGGGGATSTTAQQLRPEPWDDDGDECGLPLMHLAVLSGSIYVVQMVLEWAAAEGLGPEWVLRRHRGRSPLHLAAATAAAAGGPAGGNEGGGSGDTSFFAIVKSLLPMEQRGGIPCDKATRAAAVTSRPAAEQVLTTAAHPPAAAAAPPAPAQLWRSRSAGACDGDRETSPKPTPLAFSEDGGAKAAAYCKATQAACSGAAAGGGGGGGSGGGAAADPLFAQEPRLHLRLRGRHQLLVCLLGYPDPADEARYRQYVLPYDIHVASYWVPLMCALLASALLRPLRGAFIGGSGGGGSSDPSEVSASLIFAWPYVVMAACLVLHPPWVHSQLPRWWVLCGAARLSIKWPLCACGLLPTPPSMLRFVRSGVSLVTTALLPGLCERVPGLPGLLLRLLDAAAHQRFLLASGLATSPATAALHSALRAGLFLAASLAVEQRHRARFERAGAV